MMAQNFNCGPYWLVNRVHLFDVLNGLHESGTLFQHLPTAHRSAPKAVTGPLSITLSTETVCETFRGSQLGTELTLTQLRVPARHLFTVWGFEYLMSESMLGAAKAHATASCSRLQRFNLHSGLRGSSPRDGSP